MNTLDVHGRAADLLLALELEMRRIGFWSSTPPSAEALSSALPFARDVMTLPEWLQYVLVPRIAALIEHGAPLPTECAIRPLAVETFAQTPAAVRLVEILGDFDRLLTVTDADA